MELLQMSLSPPWEWPEDADELFLETMRDKSASEVDREMAVQMAGDYTVINDELADALKEILLNKEEPENLRRLAALSFGPALENAFVSEFDDPDDILISENRYHEIREVLKQVFDDQDEPIDVRRGVLEASVRAPEDWHEGVVREAYESENELWHLTGVFCMNYVEGFEDEIVKSLKHPDELVRYHAVSAAGSWQVDGAWSFVKKVLETEKEDIDLLLAALESAAAIRPVEARELIEPFTESEDTLIADGALNAISLAVALMEEELDEDSYDD